jgi:hypothetical protein
MRVPTTVNGKWLNAHVERTESNFMSTIAKTHQSTAEQNLKKIGVELPAPPEPFGVYVEAAQSGNLLFLTSMLPTERRSAKFLSRRARN